jgi:PKHD-type hydroxylase
MYLRLPRLLAPGRLEAVRLAVARAAFAEGKATAGFLAKGVKRNLQVDWEKTPGREELQSAVVGAIRANPLVTAAVLPKRISAPLFSKHEPGMFYGAHMDNPILGGDAPLRADVAITVFLSDPAAYDGGELVVATPLGEASFKLPAGDAVVYPATSLHRVAEVTRGARLAAVAWMQSMVAEAGRREVLYDLDTAYRHAIAKEPEADEAKLLLKAYGNLVRMWAET